MTGFVVVIALHILLGWALLNGLARKVVEVVKGPIETKIIEDVKPPPPPPPENLPPPPKLAPPPPSFVPPPEVQVAVQPTAPTITTTTTPPPPAPVVIAPPPRPVAQPAPAPAPVRKPVPARIDVSTCDKPDYPPAAARAEATGTTRIRFVVDAEGKVSKADVEGAAGASREHRLLDRTALEALSKCRFKPGTDEQGKPVGGTTVVEYVWKLE